MASLFKVAMLPEPLPAQNLDTQKSRKRCSPSPANISMGETNGKVENAVKTYEGLLLKAKKDKRDPILAILAWRNIPSEGCSPKSEGSAHAHLAANCGKVTPAQK